MNLLKTIVCHIKTRTDLELSKYNYYYNTSHSYYNIRDKHFLIGYMQLRGHRLQVIPYLLVNSDFHLDSKLNFNIYNIKLDKALKQIDDFLLKSRSPSK